MAWPQADRPRRMSQVVVDTDVVSFLFKNHPLGQSYDPELAGRVAVISFMTVAEVERWAVQHRWSVQRVHWLHLYLQRFTVVPSSPDLCRKWAEVMVAAQGAGRRIECPTPGSLRLRYFMAPRWSRITGAITSAFPA